MCLHPPEDCYGLFHVPGFVSGGYEGVVRDCVPRDFPLRHVPGVLHRLRPVPRLVARRYYGRVGARVRLDPPPPHHLEHAPRPGEVAGLLTARDEGVVDVDVVGLRPRDLPHLLEEAEGDPRLPLLRARHDAQHDHSRVGREAVRHHVVDKAQRVPHVAHLRQPSQDQVVRLGVGLHFRGGHAPEHFQDARVVVVVLEGEHDRVVRAHLWTKSLRRHLHEHLHGLVIEALPVAHADEQVEGRGVRIHPRPAHLVQHLEPRARLPAPLARQDESMKGAAVRGHPRVHNLHECAEHHVQPPPLRIRQRHRVEGDHIRADAVRLHLLKHLHRCLPLPRTLARVDHSAVRVKVPPHPRRRHLLVVL
mmetsp:Transcript_47981/g.153760  ORF Transcript_47981/g.153760 Transcript_47981/m.153760 type:complete len:362 (-) Transcript_47981:802-1887(-)